MRLVKQTHSPLVFAALLLALPLVGCAATSAAEPGESEPATTENSAAAENGVPSGASIATFASGCFWCVESIYESVQGVYEAVSGYAGGTEKNPTYRQVAGGASSHAEAVQVYYDSSQVSFEQLVDVFFASQNPTQVNGQGPDRGPQYRSIIFFENEEEREIAEQAKAALDASGAYDRPIAAEIKPLERFWRAEEYHQDYEVKNPNNPYIRGVSIPRLKRFQAKKPELLKKDGGH